MRRIKLFFILIFVLIFVFFGLNFPIVFGNEGKENFEKMCSSENIESKEKILSKREYRKLLEKCLKYFEEKNSEYEEKMERAKRKERTLQNEISYLKHKIAKLENQIYQSNLMIKDLSFQIADTQTSIEKTSLKIEEAKEKLVNILRAIYEEQQKSLLEILLQEDELSDFFDNLVALEMLNTKNKELVENIKELKNYLEKEREKLEEEKRGLEKMVAIQSWQKQKNVEAKKEQEYFLKMTEAEYQRYLQEQEKIKKRTAEIRSRIWQLIGVRKAPTYEEAVEVAKYVSKITGIRPAFLLGILTQESKIGKNVGQCYLKDPKTGMGIKFRTNQKWPRVMKPAWIPLFLEIIKELNRAKGLNLDPYATPISCWIPICVNRNYEVTYNVSVDAQGNIICPRGYPWPFGWGGAMGPAQIMPFNWIGSNNYKERIEAITGEVADPWDFRDAALGAALHLRDCGAEVSERQAAACYFGGWRNRNNPYHLRAYADPVLRLSECHQEFIEKGSMSSWCEARIF